MNKEGTGSKRRYLAASAALALCLLAIFSFQVSAQEFVDNDQDGMDDMWEEENGLNSSDPSDADEDPDLDSLSNLEEFNNSTDPGSNDTDSDGMDDGWEVRYGLDPNDANDSEEDPDRDDYSNFAEYHLDSDPSDRNDPYTGDDDDDNIVDEEEAGTNSAVCGLFFFFLAGMIFIGIGIGVYSKIRKDRLLDHKTRQKIVDYLGVNPGAYYSQIRKDLDLAHGVLTHHINILEQQELLFSKQDRSYRRFYMDGMYRKGPLVMGKQKTVLDTVRRYPGSSQSEIGRKLGMGRMIVSYHINQLDELGLLEKRKSGRENLIFALTREEEKMLGGGSSEGTAPEMGFAEN
ncbi:MAG: helix-turn-helix domain-containing protein [Candidatus Thermoplasmatota archaeon]|nr:helix-turn-helix domain-containing protein [Candidatus Thermoplasmatota archaeon]